METVVGDRPFPSCLLPLFQNEAKCPIWCENELYLHNKGESSSVLDPARSSCQTLNLDHFVLLTSDPLYTLQISFCLIRAQTKDVQASRSNRFFQLWPFLFHCSAKLPSVKDHLTTDSCKQKLQIKEDLVYIASNLPRLYVVGTPPRSNVSGRFSS